MRCDRVTSRQFLTGLFVLSATFGSVIGQVTMQEAGDRLPDGSAFLVLEAEDAYELNDDVPADQEGFGWVIVDKDDPIESMAAVAGGFDILPENTDASGGAAIMSELSGNGNQARWRVQFEQPGRYYLYTSWSVYNRDDRPDYLNEDSFYLPPAFNLNSTDDWLDFEGLDIFGEEKIGDSSRDGYIDGNVSLHANVVDKGEVFGFSSTDDEFFEGQFSWFWLSEAKDMDEFNSDVGPNGHAIFYDVSEDDVGTVMEFEITSRESYTVIDSFLFSTRDDLLEAYSQAEMDAFFNDGGLGIPGDFNGSGALDVADFDLLAAGVINGDVSFDLDGDGDADSEDRRVWVEELSNTYFGDADYNGEFNSGDFVAVFSAGKYETGEAATWAEGDWNGDQLFNSSDFVAAFSGGGYEIGPRGQAAESVPEPSSFGLVFVGLMGLARLVRKRS